MAHGISRYRKGCRCEICIAANRRRHTVRCGVCGNPMRRGTTERPVHLCGFCIADLARFGWPPYEPG